MAVVVTFPVGLDLRVQKERGMDLCSPRAFDVALVASFYNNVCLLHYISMVTLAIPLPLSSRPWRSEVEEPAVRPATLPNPSSEAARISPVTREAL